MRQVEMRIKQIKIDEGYERLMVVSMLWREHSERYSDLQFFDRHGKETDFLREIELKTKIWHRSINIFVMFDRTYHDTQFRHLSYW